MPSWIFSYRLQLNAEFLIILTRQPYSAFIFGKIFIFISDISYLIKWQICIFQICIRYICFYRLFPRIFIPFFCHATE